MNKMRERWLPYEWEKHDAYCIQAMARGEATAEQQKHALALIVNNLADTYGHTFVPGAHDQSDFLQGRRDVGLQIVKLTKIDLALIKDKSAQPGKT